MLQTGGTKYNSGNFLKIFGWGRRIQDTGYKIPDAGWVNNLRLSLFGW